MEKSIHNLSNSDNTSDSRVIPCKKRRGDTLFCRFFKGLRLHTHRKDGENTSCQKIAAAIMMLYENSKVKVCSPDGNRPLGDCRKRSAMGYTSPISVPHLRRLLTSNIDRFNENWLTLAKVRSRRYHAQTITEADYADDIALLANTPAQAGSLLHRLKKAAGNIDLYINADKTEVMCFNQNQRGEIATLNGHFSETSGQIPQSREQRLIYWKCHNNTTIESMNGYRWVIGCMDVRPMR